MSSNELHITRANYEAYFLLYVDGELSAAQSDAVEAFVALHPDLQEELDLLLTTKLDAEAVFFNKELLMSESMKQNLIDESLLLYIDDELKGEEKKNLEKKIASDNTLQLQHHLLLQTKLPAEAVHYPNKAELYRKSEPAIRPVMWYRVAAAVFVLLASGYMWYLNQNAVPPSVTVAKTPASNTSPAPQTNGTTAVAVTPSTIEVSDITTSEDRNEDAQPKLAANNTSESIASQPSASQQQEDPADRMDVTVTRNNRIAALDVSQPIASNGTQQQVINKSSVTSRPDATLNLIETTVDNPGNDQSVAIETENNKRGSVKGLLRKATRFIERRTGVATTNEDDELLIGAVAIKLK